MWKSKFYDAFVLNRRVDLHAIDATPARLRGDTLVDFHTELLGTEKWPLQQTTLSK